MELHLSKIIKHFTIPRILTLGILLILSIIYANPPTFFRILELKTYDLRLSASGPNPLSDRVVMITIDEESLERVGRWPWTRKHMAKLAATLDKASPQGVGYDISFFTREESPAQNEIYLLAEKGEELGLFPNQRLMNHLKQRLQETNPDLTFATALVEARAPHVLGYYFNLDPQAEESQHTLERAAVYPARRWMGSDEEGKSSPLPVARKARTNIDILAKTAHSQAFFNIIPDEDGTIRRYPLVIAKDGVLYQPLAVAMASLSDPSTMPVVLETDSGLLGVQAGKYDIPSNEYGAMLLHFRGQAGTIPSVPAWQVLDGNFDTDTVRGKYVLVGVTAPAVFDLRVTPVGVAYPGLEIQATALDMILKGDFIERPAWAPLYDLVFMWCLGVVCLLLLWKMKPVWSVSSFFGLFVLSILINSWILENAGFWLNLTFPLLTLSCTYFSLIIYKYIFADKQKRQMRTAFMKYLDPGVVEQIAEEPQRLKLGGECMELTVLFSDIRGFTSLSEGMEPEELVRLLNVYLTEMTSIVTHNQGLLDKYIGDAIMAVYGAPLHFEEHAVYACYSALDMLEKLNELNREWELDGRPRMDIGLGINSGEMVAGNMGSENRFNYTVMGDEVNLASRLEGLNKVYGTHCIISESTYSLVKKHFWARSLDLVKVKGKNRAVEIFELMGSHKHACPMVSFHLYEEMIQAYREGEFALALESLEELKTGSPEDSVLRLYDERLNVLLESPPKNWNGVYEAKTK